MPLRGLFSTEDLLDLALCLSGKKLCMIWGNVPEGLEVIIAGCPLVPGGGSYGSLADQCSHGQRAITMLGN